jgi:hypothetical protein
MGHRMIFLFAFISNNIDSDLELLINRMEQEHHNITYVTSIKNHLWNFMEKSKYSENVKIQ